MAKHLRIVGQVQGVGYRAALEAQARALKLRGWVRNRIDGSVEAMVRGAPEVVDQLIVWARRGPPAAHVSEVMIEEVDDGLVSTDRFEIVATR